MLTFIGTLLRHEAGRPRSSLLRRLTGDSIAARYNFVRRVR
jgi:hypothetical protein